jgi:hypothetical protein
MPAMCAWCGHTTATGASGRVDRLSRPAQDLPTISMQPHRIPPTPFRNNSHPYFASFFQPRRTAHSLSPGSRNCRLASFSRFSRENLPPPIDWRRADSRAPHVAVQFSSTFRLSHKPRIRYGPHNQPTLCACPSASKQWRVG